MNFHMPLGRSTTSTFVDPRRSRLVGRDVEKPRGGLRSGTFPRFDPPIVARARHTGRWTFHTNRGRSRAKLLISGQTSAIPPRGVATWRAGRGGRRESAPVAFFFFRFFSSFYAVFPIILAPGRPTQGSWIGRSPAHAPTCCMQVWAPPCLCSYILLQ